MFKMCFKTHRIQKIYLKKTFFFSSTMKIWGVELGNFFDGGRKKKSLFLNIFFGFYGF